MVDEFPRFLDEFEALLTENEILMARTQGVGVLPRELAVNASITGPMLRASGVNYDIRKVDKYGIYDRFEFRVPLGEHGDVYDRYMMRVLEMRESLKILQQALRDIPDGPIIDPKAKLRGFRPKAGRSLRPHRSAERRAGVLPDQRRLAQSVSLPRASAELHQPDDSGGHVPRAARRGCGDHPGQRGHRAGRGGPMRIE